ncbi:MAG: DUF3987 domain-containing protein, partial [Akkermansiaceae bacterium]
TPHSQNSQNPQNLNPFPVDALPDTLKSITMETSKACLVPPALPAMVALGCLSTAMGGGIRIASTNGRIIHGNLFVLCIAKSGTGKGATYSIVSRPLHEWNSELMDDWRTIHKPEKEGDLEIITEKIKFEKSKVVKDGASPEAYKKLLREQAEIKEELEKPPALIAEETTEEKLAVMLSGQKNEAIGNHSAEARGIVKIIMGRYSGSSTGETIYLKGYSVEPTSINRQTRSDVNLQNPCLSCLFMLQPDAMRQLTTSDAMQESGFLPRFLMADVHADFEEAPEKDLRVSEGTTQAWRSLIREVIHHCHDSLCKSTVELTDDAREMLRVESNRVGKLGKNGAPLERFHSYVARYGENLRKLHLVLHVATHGKDAEDHKADATTAQQAIEIARWFFDETLAVLRSGRADKQKELMTRLAKIINRTDDKEVTMRDLKKSHTINESDVEELQEIFPGVFEVEEREPGKKGGRPSTVVRLAS